MGSEIRDHGGTGETIRLRGVNLAWLHLRSGGLHQAPPPAGAPEGTRPTTADEILRSRSGVARKKQILEAYLDNWITTVDLDLVAELGFSLVRVPFSYKTLMEEDGTEKPDPIAFRWMDWARPATVTIAIGAR